MDGRVRTMFKAEAGLHWSPIFKIQKSIVMLICSAHTDASGSYLMIQPEVTSGGEGIRIPVTEEQATKIKDLEIIAKDRE